MAMHKVISAEDAERLPGCRVFTNGVFDILHWGAVGHLQPAGALGDGFILGFESGGSTCALKGELHPIVPQNERAEMLASLECVDWIVIYDEVTAERVVALIRPEVYVKGGDYRSDKGEGGDKVPPEARVVDAYGGKV